MKTYTTIQGDMWDAIAFKQMGSTDYTDQLMSVNQQHRDIYIFPAGVVLDIPEVERSTTFSLPPWKRGKA